MSDFNDRPFAAGSLIGLRAFAVDRHGQLRGPSYPVPFNPGVNEAACIDAHSMWMQQIVAMAFPEGPEATVPEMFLRRSRVSVMPGHTHGGRGCRCGFYAYTDGSNQYAALDRVTAVIEGFGVCTVGSRGFRASKARLVAFVDPAPRARLMTAVSAIVTAGCIYWAASNILAGDWLGSIVFSILGVLNGIELVVVRRRRGVVGQRFRRVRRLYPGVPVYRSQRAALRAHPLTVREAQNSTSGAS